jgi:hypothetical protein
MFFALPVILICYLPAAFIITKTGLLDKIFIGEDINAVQANSLHAQIRADVKYFDIHRDRIYNQE